MTMPRLSSAMLAELVGSYVFCLFGCGSVAVAVLTQAHQGLWQVASVWGFGIAVAIYAVGAISGAHLNPAVTLSAVLFRRNSFPATRVVPYIAAQMMGGLLAAATLFLLFGSTRRRFEAQQNPPIVRGEPGSELSPMWLAEYFPNPAIYGTDQEARALVPPILALFAEGLSSTLLVFFVFALTDPRSRLAPIHYSLEPLFIGFAVAIIIAIVAPLTQAGLNPMRDFAPRVIAYFAGWGRIAIPGPRGVEMWVYILAPLLGGPLGARVYQMLRRGLPTTAEAPGQLSGVLLSSRAPITCVATGRRDEHT